jgi:competence protein ComEC
MERRIIQHLIPKRPLCVAALGVVLVVLAGTYLIPLKTEYTAFDGAKTAEITGEVKALTYRADPYAASEAGMSIIVDVEAEESDADEDSLISGLVRCYLAEGEREPCIGQRIRIEGKPKAFRHATNPGEFDSASYYAIRGYSCSLRDCDITARSEGYSRYRQSLHIMRKEMGAAFDRHFPARQAQVLKTMVLGDKSSLEDEVKSLYQENGIIHILAISGVHISVLGIALYKLLRKGVGLKRGSAAILAGTVIASYGVMTGMSISALRAIIMFLIRVLGDVIGRTYDMITAMSLVALLVLLENPYYVQNSGFLLSFGAVTALGLFLPVWKEIWRGMGLRALGRKDREKKGKKGRVYGMVRRGKEALLATSGISLVTLPVLLYFQFSFPVYSLLLNLLVIPLMSIVMIDAVMTLILMPVLSGIGAGVLIPVIALPARLILRLYEILCLGTENLPFHTLILGKPDLWKVILYYLILGSLLVLAAFKRLGSGPMLGFVLAGLCILCFRSYGTLEITMVDVGQGDGIVVINENGNCYLFDGGSSSKTNVGTYQLLPFLKSRGIKKVTGVCISHMDDDHVNGAKAVLEQASGAGVEVGEVLLPKPTRGIPTEDMTDVVNISASKTIPLLFVQTGTKWRDHRLEFICLNPDPARNPEDRNETSEVFLMRLLTGKGRDDCVTNTCFSMLFTGDVTGEAEAQVIQGYRELFMGERLTILKVAHHGSKYSTPSEFLTLCRPALALISAGDKNRYGHPHKELLERLAEESIPYLCTAETGAITVSVRGKRVEVRTFLDNRE